METIREIARLLEDIPFTMCLLLIINVAFIVGSMRNLFRIKKGWRGFLPVIAVAFLASGTVVYIGDWGNLPLTFVVILCDVLKAVLAVLLGVWLLSFIDPTFGKYWAGLFCLLGHMFPCMFKLRGGRASSPAAPSPS